MKKTVLFILSVILLFSGCGMKETVDEVKDGASEVKDEITDGMDNITGMRTSAEENNFIGEEKAKQIALDKAGITKDGVIFDRVELEKDDGEWQYEIEFRKDGTEYDTDIKADDGKILSWDIDND